MSMFEAGMIVGSPYGSVNTDVGPAAVPAPMNFPDQQPAVFVSMFPPLALASVEVVYF